MNLINYLLRVFKNKADSLPKAGANLNEIDFVTPPYISKKGSSYFLCYQINAAVKSPLVRVLRAHKSEEKAYYFFSIPISHVEQGKPVSRDLSTDGLVENAKKDNIYWLNRDGSEIKLKILEE